MPLSSSHEYAVRVTITSLALILLTFVKDRHGRRRVTWPRHARRALHPAQALVVHDGFPWDWTILMWSRTWTEWIGVSLVLSSGLVQRVPQVYNCTRACLRVGVLSKSQHHSGWLVNADLMLINNWCKWQVLVHRIDLNAFSIFASVLRLSSAFSSVCKIHLPGRCFVVVSAAFSDDLMT